jgi:hypothetical protein
MKKKQRLKLPHSDEDIHVINHNVTPRHPVDEMPSMDNIIPTFYQTLPVSAGFLCGEGMAGDHLHTVVEECKVCRAVEEIISFEEASIGLCQDSEDQKVIGLGRLGLKH